MLAHKNILIAGGTGSGKTTLLNIVGKFIPQDERILLIEDTSESPGLHEVVDAEMPRVELSNGQGDAVQTAGRNDSGDTAPMKAALRFVQEFEVLRHRHNVLPFFESLADLEISQDFARHIGLERLLHDEAEALRCPRKLGVCRGYIKEAKSLKLAKERLVGCEMCQKACDGSEAGIDEGQRDHRGRSGERCRSKEGELIHEIAKGRTASGPGRTASGPCPSPKLWEY